MQNDLIISIHTLFFAIFAVENTATESPPLILLISQDAQQSNMSCPLSQDHLSKILSLASSLSNSLLHSNAHCQASTRHNLTNTFLHMSKTTDLKTIDTAATTTTTIYGVIFISSYKKPAWSYKSTNFKVYAVNRNIVRSFVSTTNKPESIAVNMQGNYNLH